ncbi:flagellar export protein FliJ [Aneurinibacillus sp. Ricciae_BoGa-3]|uniref:flagellar export protein FliJ n=1 Tax=Aneurinibacillus sp. Ricciae_BoGa-3 TaxID=3022697 RepID=UPI0023424A11|nr:flagellar export protein FliJ [Aneurinibacillus sp. Ricciae_BoGa-3]WCK52897.1 flagellar export protein FliJ [Aneurinibacillus sp. Ricciae_BoGa-3]
MSFVYSFQKLLDLKEKEKEQAQMGYAKSREALEQEDARLQKLVQDKVQMQRVIYQKTEANITMADLRNSYEYLDHMQQLIIKAHHTRAEAEQVMRHQQEALQQKALDEKVWKKLKENSHMQYTEKLKQQEQKELDEMAVARYFRQHVRPR